MKRIVANTPPNEQTNDICVLEYYDVEWSNKAIEFI